MPVMNSKGDIFDERRKEERRKQNIDVAVERRKEERRKENINITTKPDNNIQPSSDNDNSNININQSSIEE